MRILIGKAFYFVHIKYIPTNKGANSYKLKKSQNREFISLMYFYVITIFCKLLIQ